MRPESSEADYLLPAHMQVLCGPLGWRGWSCTDNSTAQTVAQQRAAALLLTLSNLMFLAPIAVSLHRSFLVEASVYFYTMFFSTVGLALIPWGNWVGRSGLLLTAVPHSSTMPVTSRGRQCCASSAMTHSSTATFWAQGRPPG